MNDDLIKEPSDPVLGKLRNLSLHLQGALANRTEEGDTEAAYWLKDGINAIDAAIGKVGVFNIWDAMWHDAEEDAERLRGILHTIHSQYIINRGDMTDAEALHAIGLLASAEGSSALEDEITRLREALEYIVKWDQPCDVKDCLRDADGKTRVDPTKTYDGVFAKVARAALAGSTEAEAGDPDPRPGRVLTHSHLRIYRQIANGTTGAFMAPADVGTLLDEIERLRTEIAIARGPTSRN